MKIALDYDGTFTHDPALWLIFVIQAQYNGHDIRVVTMRYASEEMGGAEAAAIDQRLRGLNVPIIFTGRQAKLPVCRLLHDWEPDVWIDDNPRAVHMSALEIWGDHKPEGQPHDPNFVKEKTNG